MYINNIINKILWRNFLVQFNNYKNFLLYRGK